MPITITSFSPNLGHTGGDAVIEILGSGFRLPTPQTADPNEAIPESPPSVRVQFGSTEAKAVTVLGAGRILAITPPHIEGDVAITVINIDDAGNTIESQTTVELFSFRLPQLGDNWVLTTIVDDLIEKLQTQLHPNVSHMHHPDYANEDVDAFIFDTADLPAWALIGPDITENRFYSLNDLQEDSIGSDEFLTRRENKTVDLVFDLIGFSDAMSEQLAMMQAVVEVLHKLKFLSHPLDPTCLVEVDLTDHPKPSKISNESGLHVSRSEVTIRGFDLGGLPRFQQDLSSSFVRTALDDDSAVQISLAGQFGDSTVSTSGPGLPLTSPAKDPAEINDKLGFPKFGSIPAQGSVTK